MATVKWWQSGLVGIGAGLPMVWAVWAFTADVSAVDGLGVILVFFWYGPMIVAFLAVAGWIAVLAVVGNGKARWRYWWWVVATPLALWGVLLIGALTSGPTGSAPEQRLGWSLVVVVIYGAVGAGFAQRAPRVVRLLASMIVVAAAPLMIVYDDASQYRWRKATFASAPQVLPVIPGYAVVAARGDGQALEVTMRGPTDLRVSVLRCRDCSVRQEYAVNGMTVVDGSFELWVPAVDNPAGHWVALDGIHVRPASIDELASLPLAVSRSAD
ncbi:hypothetical protein KZZ52_20785 [Dactylosporangium sp. AC04546]|uniref:hypothetical protein n=1 Tax=Dactylosporangium sp. AC04546 TaxID=2862460 RepID=UPI001EE043BD|nr:hypothetical protein [Dactylosporangium sp. AC04546]WVK87726.1 hypothetical protein KZZ52_20785 [Dactylosporangium sp. AC04546]